MSYGPTRYAHLAATGHIGPIGGKDAGGATLCRINVNTGTATSVVTVYDGQDNTGTVVAVIDASAKGTYHYDRTWLKGGLYVVMATANSDITVIYE